MIATAVGVNKHEFVLLMQTIWRRHRLAQERRAKEQQAVRYGTGYNRKRAPEFVKLDKSAFLTCFALMVNSSHRTFLAREAFAEHSCIVPPLHFMPSRWARFVL